MDSCNERAKRLWNQLTFKVRRTEPTPRIRTKRNPNLVFKILLHSSAQEEPTGHRNSQPGNPNLILEPSGFCLFGVDGVLPRGNVDAHHLAEVEGKEKQGGNVYNKTAFKKQRDSMFVFGSRVGDG